MKRSQALARMRTIAAFPFLLLAGLAQAQLTVSPQTDLQQLAHTITGPGVTIANPQIDCHSDGYGEFQYTGSLLGIDQGILLTSGTIDNAVGPNDEENTTFQQNTGGSSILNEVTGRTTKDACKFEFDIIPAGDSLRFDFVFGSEEYNEWVGSQYNDVFGFFISGPGISGDPGIGNDHNIALVPGTNQAVTINNVNNGSNSAYFHDNAGGPYVQYDGFTQGLSAIAQVQPCETYHLKLIVADASDRKYDSGVFIAEVKSNPVTMQLVTLNGPDSLIEGCNNGVVRFTRQTVTDQAMPLQYFLHGTATNGTDYTAIGNVDPDVPKTISIPANAAYVDQPVNTLYDALPEDQETLLFILGNPNCPGALADTLVVPLVDSLNASIQPLISTICQGEQVQLSATGGTQYTWSPAAGLSATNIPNPVAQPTTTRTYSVFVQDGACSRTFSTQVKVSSLALNGTITRPLCNGATNGAINLSTTGGIPPYSFQWTGPNGFSSTSEDISNIGAGTYTVTATDAACETAASFNVTEPATLGVALTPSLLIFGQNISCSGGHDGSIDATITGGTAPYSASWTGPAGYSSNTIDISNLGAGTYTITVTDAGGCTATASTTLTESAPMVASITSTTPVACANDNNGSATVSITGGMPTYTYSWNTVPVQSAATATGLAPGTYTVTAYDQYGCSVSTTATITGPVQPLSAQLASKTDVACHGAASGQATITVSGGTPGYSVSWNTTPVQTGITASGLSGGSYTATVTDQNGCSTSLSVTIAEPAMDLSVSLSAQENIACLGQSGSATVSASGGSGPYAYSWNTVPPQNGASASGLTAGIYTVIVTDAHGCTATLDVTITAPAAALSASITASSDVLCFGGNDGSATVEATGGTAPYTLQWNTTPAQSGTQATGLGVGSWQVLVADANGCQAQATATISQPNALTVAGTVSPALCQGAANGSVDVTTSAGTAPYSWSWSGPAGYTATTEDISNLTAGGYTLVVTDAHGCTATRSFDVNQPGLFNATLTPADHGNANISCPGGNDGAIDLEVSGALPPYSYAWTGPGGFSAISQDISGVPAGEYAVTITDQNGCSTSLDTVLAEPAALNATLVTSDFGGAAIACNGGSNGTITTTINGGNPPYSTAWAGPAGYSSSQEDLTGLGAGSYQLTITDGNGCSTDQSVQLTEPALLTATNGGTSAVSCYGSNNGQATVHVSGGVAPYSYSWNTIPAQHAATAMGLAAGNYTATVTDANGCTTSLPFSVGGPSAPLAIDIPSVTNVLCHQGQTGAATAQATGGTAPYSYAWNTVPPTNGPTVSGLSAGTWTVTVTDAAGCTNARNVVIGQPAQPLTAMLVYQHPMTCFGDQDGSASITVNGGSGNYAITWNTLPVQTGSTVTGLNPGNYTATIADANGCTETLPFPVTINGPSAPLTLTYAPSTFPGGANVSCPAADDGSIDISVTGGSLPYQYAWQDGAGNTYTSEDLGNLGSGSYQLIVGDSHGCFLDSVITLTAPTPISATADVGSAICHGASDGSIDLQPAGGVAPYAFQWSGPNGFTASSEDLNMIPAGVYTATITDANGCSLAQPFDVTEPGTFNFDATVTPAACNGSSEGAIQLSSSGGTAPYQFAWTGPNGFVSNTESITGLLGGTYNMILTDANGCSALASYVVQAPAPLFLFVISHKNQGGIDITCNGATDGMIGSTYGGGTPPYSFAWSGPDGFTASTPDISGLASGTYTLLLTDANGCSISASLTLVDPPVLTASAVATTYNGGSGTSCAGANDGSITLTPSGGTAPYTVNWSGPGGFTSSAWQINGLPAGTYSATVTDLNGCSVTVDQTLTAADPLALSLTSTNVSCPGGTSGSVDLAVSGGSGTYTYNWSGPNVFTSTTEDIPNAGAGTYTVNVTDANGCTASTTATVSEPAPIQTTATITTAACQGANTGAVDLSVSGGTGPYTYLWTGFPAYSATTEDISALFAGVYTVTVTDDNGCTQNASFNVGEPGVFNITAQLSSYGGGYSVSCADANDGSIDASVSGGTGPFTYFWTGPDGFTSIDLDLDSLAPGPYTLTVHDANGCNSSANFTLVAPSPILIGLSPTAEPSCSGGQDGSIAAAVQGGTAPYTISWTGPSGPLGITQHLTGVGSGTYTASVTDALGCTGTASITLTSPSGISATATATVLANGANLSCANSADGAINLDISGGTAPYGVLWNGPNGFESTDEDISDLHAGTYTGTITDANGCTFTVQNELIAPQPINLQVTTSTYSNGHAISCSGANDGTITLSVSGGSPGYMIYWSGPGGFSSSQNVLDNLAPGTYTVGVTDLAGCYETTSVTLDAPLPITTQATLSDHDGYEVGCSGNDGSIALTVGGGLAPYQFNWTGPNGFASMDEDLQGLSAGTYSVEILDANGCSISRSFTLDAPEALAVNAAVTSNECDLDNNGAIDLTVSGGTSPFTFSWSGPNGFTSADEDLSGLASGSYTVTVTSAMGCSTSSTSTVVAAAPINLDVIVSNYGQVNIPCHGDSTGTITLAVSGGFAPLTYAWTGPDGPVPGTTDLSGLVAGTYALTITDDHGCMRDTSVTLIEPATALATSLVPTNVPCTGTATGSIDATVTGGTGPYTFSWRGPDSTFYSTEDLTGIPAGSYELVVTDLNQCVNTLDVIIGEPDSALAVTFSQDDHNGYGTSCAGSSDGSINLSASGGTPGYQFNWTGPDGFTAAEDSIAGLGAGEYNLTATDNNGCSLNQPVTITAPPAITIETSATLYPGGTAISCFGLNDGVLHADLSGGVAPLAINWSGPDGFTGSSAVIDSLAAGSYCITVTDANGCTAQDCDSLVAPTVLEAATLASNAACGMANGAVDATIAGGSPGYSVLWSNGSTSEDLSDVPAGSYGITVTDANGCTATADATVGGSPAVNATAAVAQPLCHDSPDGSIIVAVQSGTAPFTFAWDNGASGDSLLNLGGGDYGITITDANGCTWDSLITVTLPDAIQVDTILSVYGNGHNISTWGGANGSIELATSGGTPPYSYAWTDGSASSTRYGLTAGTYTVTVTDANGCSLELLITLTQPDELAMPSGFTPNGDGNNDAFVIHGLDAYPNNQLTVFNRWGNVVFDQLRYANDWRGENQQGQQLPDGTYFVILRLNDELTLQHYVDLRR
jgi:gliding motility-associated-like protein